MKAARTPWWYFLAGLVVGLLFGMAAVKTAERTDVSLIGAPWTIAIALVVVGVVTLYLAWQVHQYVTADKERRKSWYDPKRAVLALVLSKTLGIVGALLAGWYFGQLVLCAPHVEASYYRNVVIQCGVTALVCLADMVVGIVGEWMCQIPPIDGPEKPGGKPNRNSRHHSVIQPVAQRRR